MHIDVVNLLVFLGIGLAAGWAAGAVMGTKSIGVLGYLIVGVIGAFLGGLLFDYIPAEVVSLLSRFAVALVGAIVLLFLLRLIKSA